MAPLGRRWIASWSKRWFDILVVSVLLIVLAPVMLLCAMAVLLGSGFPILFRQKRVGQYGRLFWIVKFRTMRSAPGAEVTATGDPRVNRVGRVLRRFKLDELPQLWNVLVGEMSLVGPRPELPSYVALHRRMYARILDLRPGHEREPRFYDVVLLPRKLALARLYRRRQSLWLDVRLIGATACVAAGLRRLGSWVAGAGVVYRARDSLSTGPGSRRRPNH